MRCTNPVRLKNPKASVVGKYNDIGLDVPCGKCMACRILITAEWRVRIQKEMFCHGNKGIFVTLTYNDSNLPADGLLVKEHIKKFVKDYCYEGKRLKFPYYFVGEYGDISQRPHYHGIIIGDGTRLADNKRHGRVYEFREAQSKWSFGFVVAGYADTQAINYVTGYIRKKLFFNRKRDGLKEAPPPPSAEGGAGGGNAAFQKYAKHILVPPFHIFSKGIGKTYFNENLDRVTKGFSRNGRVEIMPRYFKRLLKKYGHEEVLEEYVRKAREAHKEDIDNYGEVELSLVKISDSKRREADLNWKESNMRKGKL